MVSSITSSVHQDAISTHPSQTKCSRCGYRHLKTAALLQANSVITAIVLDILNPYVRCLGRRDTSRTAADRARHEEDSIATGSSSMLPSQSKQSCRSTSRCPSYMHNQCRSRRSPTPYRHEISHISLSSPHPNVTEGRLLTDIASNGQTSFHTVLQIIKTRYQTHYRQSRSRYRCKYHTPFPLKNIGRISPRQYT